LIFVSMGAWAQKKITGKVTDFGNAETLPGAKVLLKGNSKIGTVTDIDGNYTITVPGEKSTLVFSYLGYASQEVLIGNKTVINVQLKQSIQGLDEIVLVGYGTAKRADLTTAQSTVTATQLEKSVNTTLEQAIQGRAAGVYITQNSGQPGGGISVAIRGVSSINGTTEPLYVIDGVQIPGTQVSYGTTSSSNPLSGLILLMLLMFRFYRDHPLPLYMALVQQMALF